MLHLLRVFCVPYSQSSQDLPACALGAPSHPSFLQWGRKVWGGCCIFAGQNKRFIPRSGWCQKLLFSSVLCPSTSAWTWFMTGGWRAATSCEGALQRGWISSSVRENSVSSATSGDLSSITPEGCYYDLCKIKLCIKHQCHKYCKQVPMLA